MKRKKLHKMIGMLMFFACFAVLLASMEEVHASTLDDGTYTIDYTIKKPDDESVSMANDYWDKPATLIVSGGEITVQMTVNHSEWVTQFKVPSGGSFVDTKVISRDESANTRLTQFITDSVDQPMLSQIHVTVPEIDYDHDYTIRFVYDTNSLKLISEPEATATPVPTEKATAAPKPDETAASSETAAGSTSAKPSTKESTIAEKNDAAQAGKESTLPAATASSAESTDKPTVKDNAQSSNQSVDDGTNAEKESSTAAPEQATTNHTTTGSEQSLDEAAAGAELATKDNTEADKEEVELTAALDGAVAANTNSVMSASVAPKSSKQNGVIIISFLAVLLIASAVAIAIYRKRKSNTA